MADGRKRPEFVLLSDEILRLHALRSRVTEREDARIRAGMLAVELYGLDALSMASVVNMAALALAMERLVVYRPRQSAIDQVHATDLHTMPSSPPRLLRGPFLIESSDPSQVKLIGDLVAIAGYQLDGRWFMIFWRHPDGCGVFEWNGQWASEMEADMGVVLENNALVPDAEQWGMEARQAVRFLIVLGLLLDAESSPISDYVRQPERAPARKFGQKKGPAEGWQIHSLTVPPTRREPAAEAAETERSVDGLTSAMATVRGHLKQQRFGPGGLQRKWVYVASYEARRWVAPRPLRVEIKGE